MDRLAFPMLPEQEVTSVLEAATGFSFSMVELTITDHRHCPVLRRVRAARKNVEVRNSTARAG